MPEYCSRRHALKEATDPLHRELDALVSGYDLRRRDHYATFLEASAGALLAIENLLAANGVRELLPDWVLRRRGPLILEDLGRLQRTALPMAVSPEPRSIAEMLGMLYVLEGSRLGARWLYARVCSSDDAQLAAARAYLHAHDAGLWRSFLQFLESSPHARDIEAMTRGARDAFDLFHRSFVRFTPAAA